MLGGVNINEGFFLPREGGVEVDAYNGPLSKSKLESPTVLTFRGLQDGTTTATTTTLPEVTPTRIDRG